MRHGLALLLAALVAAPVQAEDFSTGSEAKSWGLAGEEQARFTARVVDASCALTGDCPADCGAGTRQMALIREADDAMILANKNAQAAFSGAVLDLAPYCGQTVEVDGLMVGDPRITGLTARFYMAQRIRPEGEAEWTKLNRFTRAWKDRFPEATGKGPWFRRDPRIRAEIEQDGYLGLGHEADDAFARDNF